MMFIVNGQIIFDADAGTIGLVGAADEKIQISNPTKRLLLLLMQQQGEAVKREIIFKKVWDDFGMISSNNNLNQCVSKLRRLIKNFGIDDEAIVTIPKIGFMLHPQIVIERSEDVPLLTPQAIEPVEPDADYVEENHHAGVSEEPAKARVWLRPHSVIVLMMVTIAILGAVLGFWIADKPLERREVFIGQAGTCKLLMSETLLQDQSGNNLKAGVLGYAKKLNPQCSSEEYILVIKSRTLRTWSKDLSRLYFMRCGTLYDGQSEVCWSVSEPPVMSQ